MNKASEQSFGNVLNSRNADPFPLSFPPTPGWNTDSVDVMTGHFIMSSLQLKAAFNIVNREWHNNKTEELGPQHRGLVYPAQDSLCWNCSMRNK